MDDEESKASKSSSLQASSKSKFSAKGSVTESSHLAQAKTIVKYIVDTIDAMTD